WSHTIDNSSNAFSTNSGNDPRIFVGPGGVPLLDLNRGNADNDIRHFFSFSSLYELPFGKGRMYAADIPTALDWVIGGWQWNNIVTLSSGTPFDINVGGTNRADVIGDPELEIQDGRYVFTGGSFAEPAGDVGTLGRNALRGPGLHTWDMSLFKNFVITERFTTQFRAEVFNLTNTPQFRNPENTELSAVTATPNAVTRFSSERQMQFALRVTF
ncbi:MAG TPA: hypothetical protein VEG32_11935, partial [Clostridia bacterium]|nr:hypothetical protein [Clostridia bacterium]